MANPPWKRELPPEPPRNNKFLSSERPETERPQISPPEVPQHLKSQNTTSTNIRDRKKDNRATIYRPSRKFMFAVLLGIAGLLFVGFLATRLNSRGEVAVRPLSGTASMANSLGWLCHTLSWPIVWGPGGNCLRFHQGWRQPRKV